MGVETRSASNGYGRHGGPARARHAGRLGLFLPRPDGRLQLRAGETRRLLPPRAHRRRPVGRFPAMRGRHLPDRDCHAGLVGRGRTVERTGNRSHMRRQRRTAPIAAPATTAGRRSPASTMRGPGILPWREPKRMACRSALCHACRRVANYDALDRAMEDWARGKEASRSFTYCRPRAWPPASARPRKTAAQLIRLLAIDGSIRSVSPSAAHGCRLRRSLRARRPVCDRHSR